MSRDYNCTIAVRANPTQTFHAICDIPKWWATNFEGEPKLPATDLLCVLAKHIR